MYLDEERIVQEGDFVVGENSNYVDTCELSQKISDKIKNPPKAKEKKPKEKKRPSDFEIFKTIMQRGNERKLPYLLKNIGEDPDILFLCSANEESFTYGSPDISIMIIELLDPELKTMVEGYLAKLYGFHLPDPRPCIINIRDQISSLNKTKGDKIDLEVETDSFGSAWHHKTDINGNTRTVFLSQSIDSLFHVQLVRLWCNLYRPILSTMDNSNIYHPYSHQEPKTHGMISIPQYGDSEHPIARFYPHGFRLRATKGIDVIMDKFILELPYPVVKQDMVVFRTHDDNASCQIAHRIISDAWRAVLVRPNAVFFPTSNIPLESTGSHLL